MNRDYDTETPQDLELPALLLGALYATAFIACLLWLAGS